MGPAPALRPASAPSSRGGSVLSPDQPTRRPIDKAFDAVRALVDLGPGAHSISEISAALDSAQSSVHRLLHQLVEAGVVERPSRGQYGLSLGFYQLASRYVAEMSLERLAEPVLHGLVERLNETARLGLYDAVQRRMMFVLSVAAEHELNLVYPINRWVSVHRGASGIAILAALDDEQVRDVLGSARDDGLPLAPAARDFALREIERTRERGFAYTHGARVPGVIGLAAPVHVASRGLLGCVNVGVPEQRFRAGSEDEIGRRVVEGARDIERAFSIDDA